MKRLRSVRSSSKLIRKVFPSGARRSKTEAAAFHLNPPQQTGNTTEFGDLDEEKIQAWHTERIEIVKSENSGLCLLEVFPIEIMLEILESLNEVALPFATLRNFSLTCKSACNIANRFLFRDIILSTLVPKSEKASERLLKFISNPRMANSVRRVTIDAKCHICALPDGNDASMEEARMFFKEITKLFFDATRERITHISFRSARCKYASESIIESYMQVFFDVLNAHDFTALRCMPLFEVQGHFSSSDRVKISNVFGNPKTAPTFWRNFSRMRSKSITVQLFPTQGCGIPMLSEVLYDPNAISLHLTGSPGGCPLSFASSSKVFACDKFGSSLRVIELKSLALRVENIVSLLNNSHNINSLVLRDVSILRLATGDQNLNDQLWLRVFKSMRFKSLMKLDVRPMLYVDPSENLKECILDDERSSLLMIFGSLFRRAFVTYTTLVGDGRKVVTKMDSYPPEACAAWNGGSFEFLGYKAVLEKLQLGGGYYFPSNVHL